MLDVVIANTAEAFAALLDRAGPDTERAIHERDLAGRALFWGGANTIVVAPEPVDPTLVEWTSEVLGHKRLEVWHPARSSLRLCSDMLQDAALLNRLAMETGRADAFRIRPYAVTPEFCELSDQLNWGNWRQAQSAATELDSKAGFRRIFEDTALLIPEGTICADAAQTATALHAIVGSGRRAAVKVHNGESGWGLRFFDPEMDAMRGLEGCRSALATLFASDLVWSAGPYIVEAYVDHDQYAPGFSPSGEARVDETGVHFDYLCDQLVSPEGEFLGVSIGAEVEQSANAAALRRWTTIVGDTLHARSYRGTYDVDFISGRDGRTYAVECNARLTGGTHVIGAARMLFGEKWPRHAFVSNDALRYGGPPLAVSEILARLDPLLLRRGSDRGILLSLVSARRPVLGAISIERDRARALSQLLSIATHLPPPSPAS